MKTLFTTLIALMFALSLSAQTFDKSKYVISEFDEVTGRTTKSSKDIIKITNDNVKGIAMYFVQTQAGDLIWAITLYEGPSCVDENATINLLFVDGTRMEFKANNDFNCDAEVVVYTGKSWRTTALIDNLQTKKLKTIRVSGYNDEPMTMTLSEENQSHLIYTVNSF